MGHRANYIIKKNESLKIYYSHWRAKHIAVDLFLGERRFVDFVQNCQEDTSIMSEPWIEGCVVIDFTKKLLIFWSSDFSRSKAVKYMYITELSKKWTGWQVLQAENRMYDIDKILPEINYMAKQDMPVFNSPDISFVMNDYAVEWPTTLVIICDDLNNLFTTLTGDLRQEDIIAYGEEIVSLMLAKPATPLPVEGTGDGSFCVFIDLAKKKIIINESIFGLWESCGNKWPGYTFMMSDHGYLELLEKININTSSLENSAEEVNKEFEELIKMRESFDSYKMAEKLKAENNNIKFNPAFFDTVRPKKTFLEKLQFRLKKIFE